MAAATSATEKNSKREAAQQADGYAKLPIALVIVGYRYAQLNLRTTKLEPTAVQRAERNTSMRSSSGG